MKYFATVLAISTLAAATSGCQKAPAAVSEADAAAAADATQAAWTSMDVAKVEAVYAPGVVGFDPIAAPLSTDATNWHNLQASFAAMKFDGITVPDRKIQILDADTFVVSGTGELTSKDGELKAAAMRFTDVYQKQADGKWLIANEHVSMKPEAPKG